MLRLFFKNIKVYGNIYCLGTDEKPASINDLNRLRFFLSVGV